MNIYVVTEGKSDKKVYKHWVPLVNGDLTYTNSFNDVTNNNFYIKSAFGYPAIKKITQAAVEEIRETNVFDRLVVSVDAEDDEFEDKRDEFDTFINDLNPTVPYKIIVQFVCLETWALGNRIIVRHHPRSRKVLEYLNYYRVDINDPESLDDYPPEDLNRAQFAKKYLKELIIDKFNRFYTAKNPDVICNDRYFSRIMERHRDTAHISSFETFIEAFS